MFGAPSRYGALPKARAFYRDVDVAARVEGASPHGLIAILYEELEKALDTLSACDRTGDFVRAGPMQSRAMSILHGLEEGLDHRRGADVAQNLGVLYREARRLLATPAGPQRAAALARARGMVAEVAGAWASIG